MNMSYIGHEYISHNSYPADLVTFTEEILKRKLHFLCREIIKYNPLSQKR